MSEKIYASLHTHTQESLNDSPCSLKELVLRAKEMDCKALALTNHGTMIGIYEFYKLCKENGIKPIIGTEAYVVDDDYGFPFREHLILLAMDNEGYHAIAHAVSESNGNLIKGFPCMTKKMLKKWFGKGSEGHGHVIATSACVQGVIAAEVLKSTYYDNYKSKNPLSEDIEIKDEFTTACNVAIDYQKLFGKDNFYMELQNHGLEIEAKSMPVLVEIANKLEIPLCASNDSHYARNSEDDVLRRSISTSLRYEKAKWRPIEQSDRELYLKSDDELKSALLKILPEVVVNSAMLGIRDIADRCNWEDVKEEHYPKYISRDGRNAEEYLDALCRANIPNLYPDWDDEKEAEYLRRFNVIKTMGFCDYLCIVADYIEYGRAAGRFDSPEQIKEIFKTPDKIFDAKVLNAYADKHNLIGLGIGPGRGSAAGSLVCYLAGITTSIDPLKFGLLPERFLNPDRVSMPDIDTDFIPTMRGLAIEYVKYKYGEDSVCCILTKSYQGPKGALRAAARVYAAKEISDKGIENKAEQDKVREKYVAIGNGLASEVPNDLGIKFKDCKDILLKNHQKNPITTEIINWAILTENMLTHYGMHAAGVIIADGHPVSDYVPLVYDTANSVWKTQCDMVESEERGLLKMDFLGLRNLNIITQSVKLIQARHSISLDATKLPFELEVFVNIFQKGFTNSIFQFESDGMKQMLKDFGPNCIEDIILLVAAYRPGPMQYIPDVTAVKKGAEAKYLIPEFEPILSVTYGKPIYQEQIMQLFQVAGFSLGEADIIRRYMSKKKTDKFMAYHDQFVNGLVQIGAPKDGAESFWNELIAFSEYAFNKAHAAAYAIVAYITAYLKHFYPVEYMCAVLNYSEFDKIPSLITDCKQMGIQILPPDINKSAADFTILDDKSILFGIKAIKGVKSGAEELIRVRNEGEYIDIKDLLTRFGTDKRIIQSLIYSGALDCFCGNRKATSMLYDELAVKFARIREKTKKFNDENSSEKVKKNATIAIEECWKLINAMDYPTIIEDNQAKLANEYEKLGIFVSGHPLDDFYIPNDVVEFYNTSSEEYLVAGVILDVEPKYDKNGNEMATITISDKTEVVNVTVFTYSWQNYRKLLQPGNIISMNVKCDVKTSYDEEGNAHTNKYYTSAKRMNCRTLTKKMPELILKINDFEEWIGTYPLLDNYIVDSGYKVVLWNEMFKELVPTTCIVSKEIIENPQFNFLFI